MDIKREWLEKDYYATLGVSPDASDKEIQSKYLKLARELHPKNIHVAHFVIDGGIRSKDRPERIGNGQDNMLEPDAIAETYLQFYDQHKSAWAWETELRPWVENF